MNRLTQQPGIGALVQLVAKWPRITAWIILSAGFIFFLVLEGRDVALSTGNWIALIVATLVVSGLAVWIISWEDEVDAQASPEGEASPARHSDNL